MKNTIQHRHRRISVCKAHNRPSFNACFVHPQNGKRMNASLRTRDELEAKARGAELEKLVNSSDWWNIDDPAIHTLDSRVVEIFFGRKPKRMSDKVLIPGKKTPWTLVQRRSPVTAQERMEHANTQRENVELKRQVFAAGNEGDGSASALRMLSRTA
jgi:hypothetical protein